MKPSRLTSLASLARSALLALASTGAHAQHRVDFTLDLTAEIAAGRFDPAKDQVGLRGATPPLDWGRTLLAHTVGAGRYALTVDFAQDASHGQPVQYKIKIDHPGAASDAGWEQEGNRTLMLEAKAQTVDRAFGSTVTAPPLSRAGTIERLAPLPSKLLPARGVQVWLPPGYAQHLQQRYPVLYLHDGQNVFDAAATGAEWRVDESAQAGVESGQLSPFIVVAIDNTAARMDEYTPVSMARGGPSVGGKAPAYARYLIEELKPFIDMHYRSLPDAAHTAVGGSSLGGLVSLWLAVHHAGTFGAALVVSPSVWWADSFALRDVAGSHWPDSHRPKLWVDIGGCEGDGALQGARKLRETLLHNGWDARSLSYLESPGATHDEAAWAVRVPAMLKFLYGR